MDNKNTSALKLDVTVRPIEQKGNLLAFAKVTINDCFAVDGIKVLTGEKGLFVNMPSAKDSKGEYRDVCFPVTADFRKELSKAVLDGYNSALEKGEKSSIKSKMQEAGKEVMAQSAPSKSDKPRGDGTRQ